MTPSDGSISRIDELVHRIESLPDAEARSTAIDLVQAIMSLHAAALERVLDIVDASAPELLPALGADEVVSRVLVLHGIHPEDFGTRFARAIDRLQRYFDSRGAGIEVLEAVPERIRVRFTGNRPGSGPAARKSIEDAIYEMVPEVGELIVEGAGEEHESGFVPLASLLAAQQA